MSLRRRRPLDWTRGSGRPSRRRPEGVDVIVPVYGAAPELSRCLASVVASTDLERHGLVLVIDGPQESDVEEALASHRSLAPETRFLRNEARRGFVTSVNRGMSESVRDVILLNSDTIVTSRWVEKLVDAAMSSGDVATVTPLSNHATLCSVPRAFEENLVPSGHDAESFGALVERVSARSYPRLPTGVGVCLYIRRAALDEIGPFDEEAFGIGYGEENDFCFRALASGWIHVADDATFIAHAGHRSFGAERDEAERRARRALARRHPAYVPTIARFMKEDPLAPIRARILDALGTRGSGVRRTPSRVVHLVHGYPPWQRAGTELYAAWLVEEQRRWRDVSVYARMDDRERAEGEAVEWMDEGVRVRRVTNNFMQRDPRVRNAIRHPSLERDFERFLLEERPDLVHVHHLAGHALSLARVARRLGIPIVQQIQDWFFLCARVSLFDASGARCSGPAVAKCARCAPMTRIPPAGSWSLVLHWLRRRAARRAFEAADAYVMGSRAIRRDFERAGLLHRSSPVFVIPYGVRLPVAGTRRLPVRHPVRFGFVGSMLPHKGLHVAAAAFAGLDPSRATFRAWGACTDDEYVRQAIATGGQAFTVAGPFAEGDKAGIFDSIDVLVVPSIGLESFGLVAREAMARGVPVIATNDGALAEIFEDAPCGESFPSGDTDALRAIVRRVVEDPRIVEQWRARIPPVLDARSHAERIEGVYAHVMESRR